MASDQLAGGREEGKEVGTPYSEVMRGSRDDSGGGRPKE
jgi:hypothetical protein